MPASNGSLHQFERYVFQPGLLEAFGWRVVDIPSSQWFNAPEAVLERIEAALGTPVPPAAEYDPFDSEMIAALQTGAVPATKPSVPAKPRKPRRTKTYANNPAPAPKAQPGTV